MNNNIRRFILSKKFLINTIAASINLLNKKSYFKKVKEREELSIFEYNKIAQHLPYYMFDNIIGSNMYGASFVLKKYAGLDVHQDIHAYIEHGVYFGSYVSIDSKINYTDKIITFSKNRLMHLEKETSKKIYSIGPYINYAEPLFGKEKLISVKQKLGKTLLIFPSHSIKNVKTEYNIDYFLDEIDKIRGEFQSLMCCLYFLDIQDKKLVDKYKKRGYKILCAGHKYDYNFLRRLRSIISLADVTYSNSVGTHIGYCISLGKSHRIIHQKLIRKGESKELFIRNKSQIKSLNNEKSIILEAFSKKIGNQDKIEIEKIVNKYWGLNELKGKEELKEILIKYN